MGESHQELIEAVIAAQEQMTQSFTALAEPDWLALDLTLTQLKSLMVLVVSAPMPMHQLAATLHLGRPATSTLVDQLVRLELLTRMEDQADRRRTLVNLTQQGRAFITRLRQGHDEKMRELLGKLSEDDLVALARILHKIAQFVAASS